MTSLKKGAAVDAALQLLPETPGVSPWQSPRHMATRKPQRHVDYLLGLNKVPTSGVSVCSGDFG
jgi:hypothetical protein